MAAAAASSQKGCCEGTSYMLLVSYFGYVEWLTIPEVMVAEDGNSRGRRAVNRSFTLTARLEGMSGDGYFELVIPQPPVNTRIRTRIAPKQIKMTNRKRPQFRRLQFFDFLPQISQGRRILNARQRQMRTRLLLFLGYSQRQQPLFRLCYQLLQRRPRMYARPQDPRRPFIRKPPQIAHVNVERFARRKRHQRLVQFIEPLLRPFANKLCRDVEIIQRTPLNQGLWPERAQQPLQP